MESANKRSSAGIWNVTSAENDANPAILSKCTIPFIIKSNNIEVGWTTFVFNYKNKFFLCADLNAVLDSMMSKVWAEGIAKFCCNTCGKVMAEKRDMKRHLESHLDMSYSCDICKKVCTTSNALRKHYYMHHRSWKLDCWKWIKIIKSKPIFFLKRFILEYTGTHSLDLDAVITVLSPEPSTRIVRNWQFSKKMKPLSAAQK